MNRRLHSLYTRTERVKIWFSTRFTYLGKLMLLVALVSFLFGLNVQGTMIYQVFTLSFCSLAFSYLITLRFSPEIHISRDLPETCVAGKRLYYRVRLHNEGKKIHKGILFREDVPVYLPDWQEFCFSQEDGEEDRNFFDRKMGYYRWLWLLRIGRYIQSDEQQLPDILAEKSAVTEVSLLPLRRGSVHLQGSVLIKIDPLGLCKREVYRIEEKNILVFPRLYSVPHFTFQGARKYHQGGIAMAQEKGDSNEFMSLREYVHGDPVKHIDWKSTARSNRTIIKQYRDEYFSRYGLVLDNFTPRSHCELFEEAVSVAASIMMSQDSVNSVLDLLFVGNECVTFTMGAGLASHQRMLETLASVATCRDTPFTDLAGLVKSHAALLSGVVLILIDFDEDRLELINYLLSNKVKTKVILLVNSLQDFHEADSLYAGIPMHVIECKDIEEQLSRI